MESFQFENDEGNFLIEDADSRHWSQNKFINFLPKFGFLRKGLELLRIVLSKIWNVYIAANTKTWSAVLLLMLVIGVNLTMFFVAVVTHPVQIDYSLTAFEVPDHKVSRRLESLIAAKNDQSKARQEEAAKKSHNRIARDTNPEVVLNSQYRQKWKLEIIYLAKDGNIFTKDKLEYIHKIEKSLLKHQKFHDFCWKTKSALKDEALKKTGHGCMPPNSLIDIFYRTDRFDGQGNKLSDIDSTVDFLLTKISTFWYVDAKFGAENRKSKFLRSQVNFGIPLKGYTEEKTSVEKQHNIFKDFLIKYVEQLGKASSDQVTVLYGSPEIYDYEIKNTFIHDVLLAAVSFGLIILLLFLLTSFSLWLTIFGVLTIIFSIPLAYFCYRVLLGIKTIGILTGTTVFVIIGIGVDDVFVFINVFKQATHLKDRRERMKHSILTAGKATFFTSFTTAAAFGANILSSVPAVHDFGLFTCILVMTCWLMVLLLMPPTIFLWQRWLVKCEMCVCFRYCCKHARRGDERLVGNEPSGISFQPMREEFELDNNSLNNDNSNSNSNGPKNAECCTVTNILTRFMNKFVSKPVIKGRFVILMLFLAVTAGSIGVITRLKTASGRPELFGSNSNLQRVLNLQSNLSGESVDCSSCTEVMGEVHPGGSHHVGKRSINRDLFLKLNSGKLADGVDDFQKDDSFHSLHHFAMLVRKSLGYAQGSNSSAAEKNALKTTQKPAQRIYSTELLTTPSTGNLSGEILTRKAHENVTRTGSTHTTPRPTTTIDDETPERKTSFMSATRTPNTEKRNIKTEPSRENKNGTATSEIKTPEVTTHQRTSENLTTPRRPTTNITTTRRTTTGIMTTDNPRTSTASPAVKSRTSEPITIDYKTHERSESNATSTRIVTTERPVTRKPITVTTQPALKSTGETSRDTRTFSLNATATTTDTVRNNGSKTSNLSTNSITTNMKSAPAEAITKPSTIESITKEKTQPEKTIVNKDSTQPLVVTTEKPTFRPTTEPLCPKPCTPVKRPILKKNAMVFLVFGIKGVDGSGNTGKHVLGDVGKPIYDDKFTMSGSKLSVAASGTLVKALCKICNAFGRNTDLVVPGGADCFPRQMYKQLKYYRYAECQNLTEPKHANKWLSLSMIGYMRGEIKWMAMTFESTTYTGKSAFKVADDYAKWQNFTQSILDQPDIPAMLKSGFQTSYSWVNMFSEIVAVNGAIYGITLSLIMCLASVIIFTGNFSLSIVVFITIAGALSLVVALFYFAGWQLGAIEAISLSILVGTSVDYTIHITEGYMMASKIEDFDHMTSKEIRLKRVSLALSHIGVSIFSSAITTLIAAIPLCLTQIRLFSKFGEILAINTGVSILYTLTICVSLLSIMGPTRYRGSFKSHFVAFIIVAVVVGIVMLVLYLLSFYGHIHIPGPSGGELFS